MRSTRTAPGAAEAARSDERKLVNEDAGRIPAR